MRSNGDVLKEFQVAKFGYPNTISFTAISQGFGPERVNSVEMGSNLYCTSESFYPLYCSFIVKGNTISHLSLMFDLV